MGVGKGDPGPMLLAWEGLLSYRGHLTSCLCLANHLSLDIQGRVTGWKGMIVQPIESKEEAVGTGPESILGWDFFCFQCPMETSCDSFFKYHPS